MKRDDIISIIEDIRTYLDEMFDHAPEILHPAEQNEQQTIKIAITLEIIETLRTLIQHTESNRLILYPQLFWLCVSLLRTDVIHIYILALQLLTQLIQNLDIWNESVQNVIIASMPKNLDPIFRGVQHYVLLGLYNPFSEPSSFDLLGQCTLLPCDFIFDSTGSRLIMNIVGLLPRLCLQLEFPNEAAAMQKCYLAATSLAEACEHARHKKIAKVFLRYSKGYYESQDKFLLDLRKPMSESFFPQFEEQIFLLLEKLLEFVGPWHYHFKEYQKAILMIMHSFLLHVDMSHSKLGDGSWIDIVASLLDTPIWQYATRVFDVAVRSSCKGIKDNSKNIQLAASVTASQQGKGKPVKAGVSTSGPFFQTPKDGTKNVVQCIDKLLATVKEQTDKKKSNITFLSLLEQINLDALPTIEMHHDAVVVHNVELDMSVDSSDLEMSEESQNGEESEFTEDYTDAATENDATSVAISTKPNRLTMDFENEQEEEMVKEFEKQLILQLQFLRPSFPYVQQSTPRAQSNASLKKVYNN